MTLLLSHSQVTTYNQCQFKWYLRYVEGWSSKTESDAQTVGTLIHEFLQVWYSSHSKEVLRLALVKKTAEVGINSDKFLQVRRAYSIVHRYVDEFVPAADNFTVLGSEVHFVVDLISPKGVPFQIQGYVDLVVKVGPNIFIMDHKTISGKFWGEMDLELDSQFTLYAALLPHSEGAWKDVNINGIMLNMLNRYEYKRDIPAIGQLVRRIRSYRSDAQKNNVLIEFGFLVDSLTEKLKEPKPHFAKALTKNCTSCEFADACLYSLKGVNPEPFLQVSHSKKVTNLALQREAFNED